MGRQSYIRVTKAHDIAALVLACALLAFGRPTLAQQVLLNGAPVAGSPNVVVQVPVPNNGVLSIEPGASIAVPGAAAVIDALDGTSITVNNAGTISSTTQQGINANGSTLTVTNSGTITSFLNGIFANPGTLASLVNTGIINSINSFGVNAANIVSLINAGQITGGGIHGISATTITSLTNSGNVTGNNRGINATTITSLVNSGTIKGTTIQGVNAATITSLQNSGTIMGFLNGVNATTITSLQNSGIITSSNSFGVVATTITNLVNFGAITGNGGNGVSGTTITNLVNQGQITGANRGVSATTLTSLTNAGTIIGNGGTAIFEFGAANTLLTLLPGSNIQGLVDLGGGVNTLNVGNGLNMATTFTGLPNIIVTNGAPFAVQGTTVAVVDPTMLAVADNVVSDLASSIFSTVTNRLNEGGNGVFSLGSYDIDGPSINVTPVAATPGDGSRGFWLKGFGGVRQIDGSGPSVDADHLFGGFVFGVDGESVAGLKLGLFAGLSTGQVDVEFNAQNIGIDSYFGGFYGRHAGDGWWLDFAVTGGILDHDTRRRVANNQVPGGIETAQADYDGYFISPEVTVGTETQITGHTVKPSFRARYVGAWFEDYAETGTAAPLTVDDREAHILEGRFQLGFMLTKGPSHGFEFRVGIDGRLLLGNEDVDATLFAQALEFDPGGADESVSGFVGGHFFDQVTDAVQIFAGAEFGTGTEVDFRADAQAGARISF